MQEKWITIYIVEDIHYASKIRHIKIKLDKLGKLGLYHLRLSD